MELLLQQYHLPLIYCLSSCSCNRTTTTWQYMLNVTFSAASDFKSGSICCTCLDISTVLVAVVFITPFNKFISCIGYSCYSSTTCTLIYCLSSCSWNRTTRSCDYMLMLLFQQEGLQGSSICCISMYIWISPCCCCFSNPPFNKFISCLWSCCWTNASTRNYIILSSICNNYLLLWYIGNIVCSNITNFFISTNPVLVSPGNNKFQPHLPHSYHGIPCNTSRTGKHLNSHIFSLAYYLWEQLYILD